jgi:hypothetical protein
VRRRSIASRADSAPPRYNSIVDAARADAVASPTMGALEMVRSANRVLVIGIGGGGDVVGALAVAEAARAVGTSAIVGGLTLERSQVDPTPGARALEEISNARRVNDVAALAGPLSSAPGGFRFSEAAMAGYLGEDTVLLDPNSGPRRVGEGLADAASTLECDLVVLLDVGGDVLAHGNEPGLISPLADAVLLASSIALEAASMPTFAAIFGAGCDGELTPAEVYERLREVQAAGGEMGELPIDAQAIERIEGAVRAVVTEASAMALRCVRGERGVAMIRGGRCEVELTELGGRLVCFKPSAALRSAARLASAIADASDLEQANDTLHRLGVRTELDKQRDEAAVRR